MLKLLKQEYPKILSIVATKAKDADLVIDLINQAQVFRILNKPINVGTVESACACRIAALPHLSANPATGSGA